MERQTLKVKEIAVYLGVSTDTIYNMVKNKQIPHIKLGGLTRFTKDEIDQWLQDQARNSVNN